MNDSSETFEASCYILPERLYNRCISYFPGSMVAMSYKVEVTTEDLKLGKSFGIDDSFLSIAIKRAFEAEEADVYRTTFHVRKNGRGQTYNLPQEAATALYNFDYDTVPVQPFSFVVEIWAFATV